MNPRRLRPALHAGACLALLGAAACGDLEPPAVKIGETVLTAGDLRALWADIPTAQRPPLSTREERLEFADLMVERRLLLEEGERLLVERPEEFSIDREAIETEILVRRLRAIEGGEAAIDSAAVEEAARRMTVVHYAEWISYTTPAAAEEAARRLGESTSFEQEQQKPDVGGSAGERRVIWSPFADPLADVVADLDVGGLAGPLLVGGEWLLVRVNRREPWEPAENAAAPSSVARGLRTRKQNEAITRLQSDLWVSAELEIDEDGIARLVARTAQAILRPGTTEHDPDWALPELAPGEEELAVARAEGEVAFSLGDYVEVIARRPLAQRPRGGNLAQDVRRVVEEQLGRRLLRDEAIRRGLRDEWFTRRLLRRERDNRLIQLAVQSIEKKVGPESAEIDAVLASLRESRADVFHRPARARVLRFDFPTRAAALRELTNLRRAGGGTARLREVLEGRGAPLDGTYHLTYLAPNSVGVPAVDQALFERGAGTLAGPFEVGNVWIVVHCLEVEPAHDLDDAEARRELAASFGGDPGVLSRWIQARRLEARVAVDEDALDALGAAA